MASFFISTTRKWKAYNNNTTQHIDNISKLPVCLYIRPQITAQTQAPKSLNKPKKKKKDFPFFLSLSRVIWPTARIFNYSNNIVWTPPFYIRRLQLLEINPPHRGRKDEKEKKVVRGERRRLLNRDVASETTITIKKKHRESLFSYLCVCVWCGQLKKEGRAWIIPDSRRRPASITDPLCVYTYVQGELLSVLMCVHSTHTHISPQFLCAAHIILPVKGDSVY